MELTRTEVDELLGAWALGALEPEVHGRVDRALAADPALARRADELVRAVGVLDAELASDAPAEVLTDLMARTRGAPRRPGPGTDPLELFAGRVRDAAALIGELDDDDWTRRARPYDWSVHGLVAHLLVVERYTRTRLGFGDDEPAGADHHLRMGGDEIAAQLRLAPEETAAAWADSTADTILRLQRGEGPAPDAQLSFHGWPFTAASLLVVRGFELWTHADDIRRATGRPLPRPPAADLRAMSELSVASLPLLLPLVAPDVRLSGARVVLTGDGGATFDLGDPDGRSTLLVADVVEYCRLVARRVSVDELVCEVEGDPELARQLLVAAQAFAI